MSFWASFALWPYYQPKKSKFWKSKIEAQKYYHFTLVYHRWQSYDVWFLTYWAWQTELFVMLSYVLFFYKSENWNFEKIKTTHRDIIILHRCTIKDNHMINGSWDVKCHRQNFYRRLGHFLSFYPPNSSKIENIKKKWKTSAEILSFYTIVPKIMIIGYAVPETWIVMDVLSVSHFEQYFSFLPP